MSRLSAVDAFFVAYQEAACIPMVLGAEVRLAGVVARPELERALTCALGVWPVLGCQVRRAVLGLRWRPRFAAADLVTEGPLTPEGPTSLAGWRNRPIDPFSAPPFQVRWAVEAGHTVLAFKAHHAALDGQAIFMVASAVLRFLAADRGGQPVPKVATPLAARVLVAPRRLLAGARLRDLLRFAKWLKVEARLGRSARLALADVAPGPSGVSARQVPMAPLLAQAQALKISPASLAAAAWMRAIGRFNADRGGAKGPISLEIPVSFRRAREGATTPGNLISPLTVFGDPEAPLAILGPTLHGTLTDALSRKLHHAVPLLAWPGAWLPWGIFRRIAVTPASTGFATSHFTLVDTPGAVVAEVAALSGGALALVGIEVWSPVCLAMGAAVLAVPWEGQLRLSITHRLNGISGADAQVLLDHLAAELA